MFFVNILSVVVGHPYLYLALVISGVDFHTTRISKGMWRIAKKGFASLPMRTKPNNNGLCLVRETKKKNQNKKKP